MSLFPTRVFALDLSTTTGWACGNVGDTPPQWGVVILPKDKGHGAVAATFEDWLDGMLEQHKPTRLVYEAPLPPNLQGDRETCYITYGLAVAAEACAWRAGIEVWSHSSQTIRTAVIGRAHLTEEEKRLRPRPTVKTAIVAPWLKSMGWDIQENNAADAAVVWAYACGLRHAGFGKRRAA